ncbi:hypothetical protein [Sporomusa termitida]|uniref:Uncharacterized protein n=1 Tax=Sporomusa termitida TaxID=2377 RepID=A0A517DRQ4_9FIRM|nr:hypothetical protein [Sporomusa termitida]QDR79997.1 hypothetical protein SPTER_13060 [Sporomusa termitida]
MLAYENFSKIKQAIAAETVEKTITLGNVLKVAKSLELFKIHVILADSIDSDNAGGVQNDVIADKFLGSEQRLQLVFIERLCIGTYKKQRTIAILNLAIDRIGTDEIYLVPELAIDISEWRYKAV